MNQSTKIIGFIAAAFVVFVTIRGELPTYMGILLGTAAQPTPAAGTQAMQGVTAPTSSAATATPAGGNSSAMMQTIMTVLPALLGG